MQPPAASATYTSGPMSKELASLRDRLSALVPNHRARQECCGHSVSLRHPATTSPEPWPLRAPPLPPCEPPDHHSPLTPSSAPGHTQLCVFPFPAYRPASPMPRVDRGRE